MFKKIPQFIDLYYNDVFGLLKIITDHQIE